MPLPGSMRSGENARLKSIPAVSPVAFSSIGRTISSVVPGYVVDSRTTVVPARSSFAADSVAALTAVRSGPSDSDSGVGTQITMTSGPCSPVPSSPVPSSPLPCSFTTAATSGTVATARKPPATIAATSASLRSSTWLRPALSESTVACLTSRPVTRSPTRTASWASGRPT